MARRSHNPDVRKDRKALEQAQDLLAALRAAYMTYRTAHWQAKGDAYYGDHLMLQRIYEESDKHVDQVAERTVGYFGAPAVDLADQVDRIGYWAEQFARETDPIRASLTATERVRELLAETFDVFKKGGQLTLGMDDLLMAISSQKDVHQYLLQQALAGRMVPVARAANRPRSRSNNPEVRKLRMGLMP